MFIYSYKLLITKYMYYSKIGVEGAGLTNQLFCLITSIIIAYKEGHRAVIVDQFRNDIKQNTCTSIADIFDITKINIFLKQHYNIIILDKNNTSFQLLEVLYGANVNYIDITDYIIQQYVKNNKLIIPKELWFNNIKGDPCPGIIKNVILKYKLNDYVIEEIYNEYLKTDIIIDFDCEYKYTFGWIDSFNNNMFEKILTNIKYNDDLIYKADFVLKEINLKKHVNIIHLRLEEDGIVHWARQNCMEQNDYRAYLEKKYIYLINKYVDKNDENILLSHSFSNGVIDYLNNNNYNYRFINKFFNEREKDAIIDFLVSKCCNNIFIGNFNIEKYLGSTFSYYVGKCMADDVVKIYIDLDRIYDAEGVIGICHN